jgi:hypothetical protein
LDFFFRFRKGQYPWRIKMATKLATKLGTLLKTFIRVLPQIQETIRVIKGEEKRPGLGGGRGKKRGLGRKTL